MAKGNGTKGGKTPGKPMLRLVAPETARDSGDSRDEAPPQAVPGHGGDVPRKPKVRGVILPALGVTAKEEAFCRAVASGCSASEAFRRSHDAADMAPQTVTAQAVRVGDRDRVRQRIDDLIREGQGNALHDRRKALSWALDRLQREAETAETDGARVAAVSLIMRHHALLTDRLEAEAVDPRDSQEIEQAIRDRLAALLRPAG